MKKIMILMCLLGVMSGCAFNTTPDSKSTTYTLDSVNPR